MTPSQYLNFMDQESFNLLSHEESTNSYFTWLCIESQEVERVQNCLVIGDVELLIHSKIFERLKKNGIGESKNYCHNLIIYKMNIISWKKNRRNWMKERT